MIPGSQNLVLLLPYVLRFASRTSVRRPYDRSRPNRPASHMTRTSRDRYPQMYAAISSAACYIVARSERPLEYVQPFPLAPTPQDLSTLAPTVPAPHSGFEHRYPLRSARSLRVAALNSCLAAVLPGRLTPLAEDREVAGLFLGVFFMALVFIVIPDTINAKSKGRSDFWSCSTVIEARPPARSS